MSSGGRLEISSSNDSLAVIEECAVSWLISGPAGGCVWLWTDCRILECVLSGD